MLQTRFGSESPSAAAFVIQGGHEAIGLAVAGKDPKQVQLVGAPSPITQTVVDPVSRLVVFRSSAPLGTGWNLSRQAPAGGVLKLPGAAGSLRIEAQVEEIGGRFLPFTLLRLGHGDGPAPQPGTPLLDASGLVAAVAHRPADEDSIYAIPAEVLNHVLESARTGSVTRGWVGLTLQPGADPPEIGRVVADSPAGRAGVKAGDVLLEINRRRIRDYGDAVNAFYLLRPEVSVQVKVRRGTVDVVMEVTPGRSRD
ncbi:PDZ domain-containing protein [Haloferula helveola]